MADTGRREKLCCFLPWVKGCLETGAHTIVGEGFIPQVSFPKDLAVSQVCSGAVTEPSLIVDVVHQAAQQLAGQGCSLPACKSALTQAPHPHAQGSVAAQREFQLLSVGT